MRSYLLIEFPDHGDFSDLKVRRRVRRLYLSIVSSDLMKKVTYFSVLPLSVYSCHCLILFALKAKAFQIDKECSNFLLQKPSRFIWNNEKKNLQKSILNKRQTRLKCDTIIDQITQHNFSPSSIDDTVTEVCAAEK